jgi:hypothetical protein
MGSSQRVRLAWSSTLRVTITTADGETRRFYYRDSPPVAPP